MIEDIAQPVPTSRHFKRREHLARGSEKQGRIYRLEEGWACQYRLMRDGRRQITALFLPGDYCEPQWLLSGIATLPVTALTPVRAFSFSLDSIHETPLAPDGSTNVITAMLAAMKSRERWLVNLGRLTATERICDLICEMFDRLQISGRVVKNRCTMPLTQYDLADIAGVTPVHVNRVLRMLRAEGMIELHNKRLTLHDRPALSRISGSALPA